MKRNIILFAFMILVTSVSTVSAKSFTYDEIKTSLYEDWNVTIKKVNNVDLKTKKFILNVHVACVDAMERGYSDGLNNRDYNYKQVMIAGMGFIKYSKIIKKIATYYDYGYNCGSKNVTNYSDAYNWAHEIMNEIYEKLNK